MTVPYRIQVAGDLALEDQQHLYSVINSVFAKVDRIFNEWNSDSEISVFNSLPAHQPMRLSPPLHQFLQDVDHYVALTEGRFDPTVGPLVDLWRTSLDQSRIPSAAARESIQEQIGWQQLEIGLETISKKTAQCGLSLSGVAKGHCVDMLVETLKQEGYPNVYVEWGGEIRCNGEHPEGRSWSVFVSKLGDSDPNNALAIVALNNSAIATSGDYLQQWRVLDDTFEPRTYSHIINPATGIPIEVKPGRIASATVMAPTCALADALATAAMLFDSIEEAQQWTQKIQQEVPGTAFWLVVRED